MLDIQRFFIAQSKVYEEVRKELPKGKKTSHWIWFILPD
jgi:uncharacterized protein (DUF1810 family)